MLEVQKFLRENSIQDLTDKFFIKTKQHQMYPNLVLFKYDQLDSPMSEKIVRECRGLILDENKDWEIVAYSFEKFFNFSEGLATEIDWNTARVYEKVDGCFLHNTKLNLWGGGKIKIGDIVNKKLNPLFVGISEKGELVPANILDRFDNGTKNNWLKIWHDPVSINGANSDSKILYTTTNHQIFLNGEFKNAGLAKIGDQLDSFGEVPNDSIIHVVKSGLLGDGSLKWNSSNCVYTEGHVERHLPYTENIRRWFGDFQIKIKSVISGYGSKMDRISSKTWKGFNSIRNEWYQDYNGKIIKRVPENLSFMDDFSVAKWYMDDGAISHSDSQLDRAVFATHGFIKEDVERLSRKLQDMYKVNVSTTYSKGWFLRVNAGKKHEIDNFWEKISTHMVPCMRYKLPEKYRASDYFEYPGGKTEIVRQRVLIKNIQHLEPSKKNFPFGRKGFDIKTSTGNYFAEGVLVHNSLMQLFYYNNQWNVATSGTPDASGEINLLPGSSFKELFWDTWNSLGFQLPTDTRITYMFELMTPYNRVIVPHKESKLLLHGMRNIDTLKEMDILSQTLYPTVKIFNLNSFEDILKTAQELNPMESEGYVVCDSNFNRVKVKSPQYCALAHMKDGFSNRRMLEIVRLGETSEFLVYFPEYTKLFQNTQEKYNKLFSEITEVYARIKDIQDQKSFALEAVKHRFSGTMFQMRKDKADTARKYLQEIPVDRLEKILSERN